MRSETISLTIKSLGPVARNEVGFRVTYGGNPVEGAVVGLTPKTLMSIIYFNKITDSRGFVAFNMDDLESVASPFEPYRSWLNTAQVDGTNLGYFKDNVTFTRGKTYELKLKEYREPPKFFIEFKVRDIIGADIFAGIFTSVEAEMLRWGGFTDVTVEKVSGTVFRVNFTPPWSEESPLIVFLSATWTFVVAMVLVVAALAIIYLIGWSFGETGLAIAGGILLLLLLFILLMAMKPKGGEVKRERTR